MPLYKIAVICIHDPHHLCETGRSSGMQRYFQFCRGCCNLSDNIRKDFGHIPEARWLDPMKGVNHGKLADYFPI